MSDYTQRKCHLGELAMETRSLTKGSPVVLHPLPSRTALPPGAARVLFRCTRSHQVYVTPKTDRVCRMENSSRRCFSTPMAAFGNDAGLRPDILLVTVMNSWKIPSVFFDNTFEIFSMFVISITTNVFFVVIYATLFVK